MKDVWFVASRCVGVQEHPCGGATMTHALGRHRITVDSDAREFFAQYRLPRQAGTDSSSELFKVLLQAQLLRPAGGDEKAWMRKAAAGALELRSGALGDQTPLLSFADALRPQLIAPAGAEDAPLVLSKALAVADLSPYGVLVTHPLGMPTHVTPTLWLFAQYFATAKRPPPDQMKAAAFLLRRRLLWQLGEEAQAAAALPSPSAQFRSEQPAASRFWQFWRPFDLAEVNRPMRDVSIIAIGPCLAQQHLEILTHFALQHGIVLSSEGDLDASSKLLTYVHDVVFYHPGKFTPALTQAAVLNDLELCVDVREKICRALEADLRAIRTQSSRPIITPLFSKPRVSSTRPGDAMELWLDQTYAALNMELARLGAEYGDVRLIDEMRDRDLLGVGRYKDDIFNASTHNAPLVNWSVPILKTSLQCVNPDAFAEHLTPPRADAQIDPCAVLAASTLRALLQLWEGASPIGLVLEPNALLWQGRLDDRDTTAVLRQMLLVGPENDYFAGVQEALVGLAARGIKIWLRTASSVGSIRALLDEMAPYPQLLGRHRLAGVLASGVDGAEALESGSYIGDATVLRVNLMDPQAWEAEGPQFPAAFRWRFREYLLSAPELMWQSNGDAARTIAAVNGAAREKLMPQSPQAATTPEADLPHVVAVLDRALAVVTGLSLDEIAKTEHLADLGVDSLAILQVIAKVEKRLQVSLPSWYRLESIAYNKAKLAQAFAQTAGAATRPLPANTQG